MQLTSEHDFLLLLIFDFNIITYWFHLGWWLFWVRLQEINSFITMALRGSHNQMMRGSKEKNSPLQPNGLRSTLADRFDMTCTVCNLQARFGTLSCAEITLHSNGSAFEGERRMYIFASYVFLNVSQWSCNSGGNKKKWVTAVVNMKCGS